MSETTAAGVSGYIWHRAKTWTSVLRVVAVVVERDTRQGELLHHTFYLATEVIHNVIEGVPEIRAHLFKSPKLKAGDTWVLTTKEAGQWLIYCGTHKHKMRDFRLQVVERPE